MKIVKIFGLVVAVHAAVFLLIFAIPGCRSSGRKAAEGDAAGTGYPAAVPATAMGAAPASTRPAGINATDTTVRPAAGYDSSNVRFSPTRPAATAGAATLPSAPSLAPAAEAPAAAVYTVVAGDSLWAVAKKHGVSVAELNAVNSLTSQTLKPGQTLIIPRAEEVSAPIGAADAAAAVSERPTYTVRSGDTLGAIARRHGTSVAALKSANRLTSDIVRVGQQLVLPSDSAPVASAVAAPAAPVSTATPAAVRGAGGMTHTVAPGETLSEIAKKYGVPYRDIATANNIGDPRSLRVGQVLTIPGWQAPAGGATKAPAVSAPAPAPAPTQTVPTLTPRPADNNAPTVNLIIPGANQPQTPAPQSAGDVPVIRVEESPANDGAPRIE